MPAWIAARLGGQFVLELAALPAIETDGGDSLECRFDRGSEFR